MQTKATNNSFNTSSLEDEVYTQLKEKFNIIKDDLYDLYIVENYSRKDLAKIYNVSETTIKRKLSEFDIHKSQTQIQQNREKTFLSRYDIKTPGESKEFKEKRIKTSLSKYGTDNPSKCQDIRQKESAIVIDKWKLNHDERLQKSKNTNLASFGYVHNMQSPELKNKGYINLAITSGYNGTEEELIKIGKQIKLQKEINTKYINNSFNISKPEDNVYELLSESFDNVIRQYHCERYPFNCDFYIKSLDLFIECNFHWTHGIVNHKIYAPYNPENPEHQQILQLWQNKHTKYFDAAIKTWTVRDPLKLKTARDNNLNYLVFYTYDEFEIWFNSI